MTNHFLHRCLAVRSCNKQDRNAKLFSVEICKLSVTIGCILYDKQRQFGFPIFFIPFLIDNSCKCSLLPDLFNKIMPIEILAAKGNEKVAKKGIPDRSSVRTLERVNVRH